jgi:fused signal recognition particle receptor
MFGFGKRKAEKSATAVTPEATKGVFGRLKDRLARTRSGLLDGIGGLVLGRKQIDADVLDELEMYLLGADVGVEATRGIIDDLTERMSRQQLGDSAALLAALREDMEAILAPCSQPLQIDPRHSPYVILMVGINGVGKTTTIGKLAKRFQSEGHSVMLAAGDTFRAAAVEQLKVWGERNDVAVIAQPRSADPASVIYDAVESARARGIDVLIADTAGRLHTQTNLMEELKKIKRVIGKLDDTAPHEVMLVVDAGTGQNALAQAEQFNAAVGLTGLTLTKLDGTAKGGVIFALARKLGVPIRFIGVGEAIEDLRPFDAAEFVAALFATETIDQ